MRRLYALFLFGLLSATAAAQERTITGTVAAAEDGSMLPGVNVVLKGTTQGVVTDVNGAYSISVPGPQAIITYSYIGRISQEEAVGERSVINVRLANTSQELSEVVVTGVAISRDKRSLGYGVQTVGSEQITSSRESNVVNALNSKVAGVQVISSSGSPGASASIRIRGTNSISSDYQPLFVIDGVPIDNSEFASAQERDANTPFTQGVSNSNRAVDINPQDIDNVTVLKGPAAAAIYGIRAANGAIIITTKKGRNNPGGKLSVTLSSRFSVDQVNKLPELQNKFAQGSRGRYRGPETGASGSWGPAVDTLRYANSNITGAFPEGYPFNNGLGPIVGRSAANAGNTPVRTFDPPRDFFVPGYTWDNNVSLSGGSERSTFYGSINRYTQTGIIPNTDFKKTSLRFTASTQVTPKLELMSSINYVNSGGARAQQGSNTSGIMLGLLRTPITFDNSGGFDRAWENPTAYLVPDGRQRSYRFRNSDASVTYDNPYFTVARNLTRDNVDRFLGFGEARYKFADWISTTYRLGIDAYSDRRKGGFDINSSAYPQGRAFEDRITNRIINSDLIVSMRRKVNGFDIVGNFGHNVYSSRNDRIYQQVDNLGIANFLSLSNGTSFYGYQQNSRILRYGLYGDVNVGYADRYYLGVTLRNDWSSTLPKANNSFLYGTVNGGYVFSEDFFPQNEVVNFAKIRGSFAQVGRDAPAQSVNTVFGQGSFVDGYTSGILFPFNGQNGYSQGTTAGSSQPVLGNPNLKPEVNRTYEAGLEMQFFKNRASFDLNFYLADNRNQIVLAPIASSSGFQYQTVNSGRLQNKGIELTLNATPVLSPSGFRWDITANYTRNISKVLALAPGIDNLFLNGFTGSGAYAIPGQPFSVFYGTDFARTPDGRVLLFRDATTGELAPQLSGTPRILGDPNPTFLANLRNRFEFKGFFVNTLLDIRVGGTVWNGTRGALDFFGRSKETETRGDTLSMTGVLADANGNPTQETVTARIVRDQSWYQNLGSSFIGSNAWSMETVNWVRMRELTLGYTFNSGLVKRLGVASLQVSAYARNLFLITNYKGVDPETSLTGTSNGFGIDYFNNPNTRTFGGNVVVSF